MKNKLPKIALIMGLATTNIAFAGDILTGKVKLACEAILCLSTGSPPGACGPSLSEYFSIDFDDFSDTIKGRVNFLELCPVASQTPEMASLVQAIAHGAGRCDAASLNATLITYNGGGMGGIGQGCISGNKPAYCAAYEGHQFTRLEGGASYVIDPPRQTGFWPFGGISGNGIGSIGMGGIYNTPQSCGHWVD